MEFSELPEFARDLKRLQKKYLSLSKDLEDLKSYLTVKPRGTGSKHWNCIHKTEKVEVYKVRLTCAYLNASTMRVIYGHRIEKGRIDLIELYYKSEQENEDRGRIKKYLKDIV